MEAHRQYLQSEERKKAVSAARKKSEDQEKLKRTAHAVRQKLVRAKFLYQKVQRQSDSWYKLTPNEKELYWRYDRGSLDQEVRLANQAYGHSFATRDPGGSARVRDIMQDLIRVSRNLPS